MHLLDPAGITYPTFFNTWFFALIKSNIKKALGSKGKSDAAEQTEVKGFDVSDSDDGSSVAGSDSGRSSNQDSKPTRGPQATIMAGGRRRKQASRRK